MSRNLRHTARYRLYKNRIRKLWEADKIEEISVDTTKSKARLIVYLRIGKPLIYRGPISKPLYKFIHKKEYPNQ